MSSSNADLPPYSEKQAWKEKSVPRAHAASRIAGTVQTCSIRDFQTDYLAIVRDSATSYHIALTVDPTPLYRIELVSSSTKVGDIQIFSASDSTLPIAAARLSEKAKSKSDPLAMICTSSPTDPDASWRPIFRLSTFSDGDYRTEMPIVTVPGRPAAPHKFSWRLTLAEPYYQLMWDGPLPLVPDWMFRKEDRGSEYIFATMAKKKAYGEDNLVEMRRGGGMDFELSVILELFVIMQLRKEELM